MRERGTERRGRKSLWFWKLVPREGSSVASFSNKILERAVELQIGPVVDLDGKTERNTRAVHRNAKKLKKLGEILLQPGKSVRRKLAQKLMRLRTYIKGGEESAAA